MRTNATRQLDKIGVSYTLRDYEVDLDDLSAAMWRARLGYQSTRCSRPLVVKGDRNGIALAVVPGDSELDLKALARVSGNRKMEMVPLSELQQLTGYVRGGVTALACKKPYPVFLDSSAGNLCRHRSFGWSPGHPNRPLTAGLRKCRWRAGGQDCPRFGPDG